MRVLIQLYADSSKRILVDLPARVLIEEIKVLLNEGRYSEAVSAALSKGRMIKELDGNAHEELEACAVLTQTSIHYDLI